MRTLTTIELQALQKETSCLVLLHVSEAALFAKEHIAQSVNVPAGDPRFVERVRDLVGDDPDCQIVVYNAAGDDAAARRALDRLRQAGIGRVYHYADGIAAWREAGIMLESTPGSPVRDA